MTQPEEDLALAAGFPQPTADAWRKLVEAALKGSPLESLSSTTYDGLRIDPLAARRADTQPIAGRAGAAAWQVQARIDHPDPVAAHEMAREEVENGATALSFVFAGAAGDYGCALPAREEVLARVLEGLDLGDGLAIELDLSPHAEAAVDAALARGMPSLPTARAARLRLGHDPLGAMALAGGAAPPWSEQAPHFARRLAGLAREGFDQQKLAAADGRIIHNAGGSEAQELAFVLGVALAYLRALEAEDVPLDSARHMIFFRLGADADQLLTIAKFRALRKLWARVEAACGLVPAPAFVCAETAWRMMAQRDPHANILRATVAVFGAALGGADAISVLPFSVALGLPDAFARRIARNTQFVLLEESKLEKVADPAAGSGAFEDLTSQLCRAAWSDFQKIESAGGAGAALASGSIRGKVAAVRAQRMSGLACGKEPLTGVSIFANLGEVRPPTLLPRAARENALESLSPIRLAQPFEALRDASDRHLAATGRRPRIFLACLGSEADFTPRATFATNFFAAGGIEATTKAEQGSTLGESLKTSGASLACLCGTDKTYDSGAAGVARSLKAAGARHVYLVGRPGAQETALRAAGVETFIDEGCDALAILRAAYDILGIEEAAR
jgi:methylmalonyl-CoA mutase